MITIDPIVTVNLNPETSKQKKLLFHIEINKLVDNLVITLKEVLIQ